MITKRGISTKVAAAFKDWVKNVISYKAKQLGLIWAGGQMYLVPPLLQNKAKPLILKSYQFGSGQCQGERRCPPATPSKPTAHLLHRHIRQRWPSKHTHKHSHKHSHQRQQAKLKLGSWLRLRGTTVPTCNIKDVESGGAAPQYSLLIGLLYCTNPSALNPPPLTQTHRETQYQGVEFKKFNGLVLMCGILKWTLNLMNSCTLDLHIRDSWAV